MLRVKTQIQISQNPSQAWPNRKTVLNLSFCNEYECSDSWRDLTNEGKIIIPKNLYFRDQFGKLRPLHGTNINIGGFSSNAPLLLRGDKVVISSGYKYFAKTNDQRETTLTSVLFTGYVSEVGSRIPMEAKLEDNMWLLKQTPVDTKTFKKSDGLNVILKYLTDKCNSIFNAGLTFNSLTNTTFGDFPIGNETACQVLQRLQKTFGFESYFRGNELRCGAIIYLASDAITRTFTFQKDIIEHDELEYVRKDDITLSAVARNTITEGTGKLCKDGTEKTKKVRLEVLVSLKNGIKTVKTISKGETPSPNTEGERRTLFFPGAKTTQELADLAFAELQKYYYDGLKGKFVAFGQPLVRQGDNIKFIDPIMPERNGTYKVKRVDYKGGVGGLRQEIHLDFKINI